MIYNFRHVMGFYGMDSSSNASTFASCKQYADLIYIAATSVSATLPHWSFTDRHQMAGKDNIQNIA
jgi:hypothetical protein